MSAGYVDGIIKGQYRVHGGLDWYWKGEVITPTTHRACIQSLLASQLIPRCAQLNPCLSLKALRMILTFVYVLLLCVGAEAAPRIKSAKEKRLFGPTVKTTTPEATIEGSVLPFIGSAGGFVENFKGIPFAQPPVGNNRLRPPVPLDPSSSLGNVDATTLLPKQCPQFLLGEDIQIPNVPGVAADVLETVVDSPLLKNNIIGGQEDCLTVNVQRPAGTKAGDNLPVMLWIFGGGFELGSTAMYDGSNVVARSVELGKPVVFAAVNYRVGGFGFLGGKEVLAEGSANLGLLDQRLGMQWVADNIASFGGDPDKVTLWGESAGAISIFDQLIANNGKVTRAFTSPNLAG